MKLIKISIILMLMILFIIYIFNIHIYLIEQYTVNVFDKIIIQKQYKLKYKKHYINYDFSYLKFILQGGDNVL